VLQLLDNAPFDGPSFPVSGSETRVVSESAMDGLLESARVNSGVLTISVSLLSIRFSSTDLVGDSGVGGGGAHSKSKYGFFHLGILVQHIAMRKNCKLAESWRCTRVKFS
jgi:hypothetical protein